MSGDARAWRRAALGGGFVVLLLATAVRLAWRAQRPEPEAERGATSATSVADAPAHSELSRAVAPASSAPSAPVGVPRGGAPALRAADAGPERSLPHPLGDERLGLMPPWATFDAVKTALRRGDFESARSILKHARASDAHAPEWRDFHDGLELVADCLEAPSPESRERALAFMSRHRASPLRRHVRRSCLHESAAARR